ncbi:MAG: hypothetical protein IJV07_01765 [Alphaproteobacteria bacterium]|nr:hypothetical protein [Alphaproteobacteria bacterium]
MAVILQSFDIMQVLCPHKEFDVDAFPSEEEPVQDNMRQLVEAEKRWGIALNWLSRPVHKPFRLTHKPLSKVLMSHIGERTRS